MPYGYLDSQGNRVYTGQAGSINNLVFNSKQVVAKYTLTCKPCNTVIKLLGNNYFCPNCMFKMSKLEFEK